MPGIASAKHNFRLHFEFRLRERAPDTFLPDSVWDAAVSGQWNDGASFIYFDTTITGAGAGRFKNFMAKCDGNLRYFVYAIAPRSRSSSLSSAASGRRTDSTTRLTDSETTFPSTSTPWRAAATSRWSSTSRPTDQSREAWRRGTSAGVEARRHLHRICNRTSTRSRPEPTTASAPPSTRSASRIWPARPSDTPAPHDTRRPTDQGPERTGRPVHRPR